MYTKCLSWRIVKKSIEIYSFNKNLNFTMNCLLLLTLFVYFEYDCYRVDSCSVSLFGITNAFDTHFTTMVILINPCNIFNFSRLSLSVHVLCI